jgi:2-haloacid dehalogenase
MPIFRREFLGAGAGFVASMLAYNSVAAARSDMRFKALAFDAFPVFDPHPVAALCETLFPSRGAELVSTWRTRQFEYALLRTISDRYADFEQVTDESLVFATRMLKLDLTAEKRERLLKAHFELNAWPDATPALRVLKAAGLRLAFLSNLTPNMLNGCIKTAGLDGVFDQILSTDMAKTYKPDVRAYQVGMQSLRLPREEILFVAFAGWDAAGARSFGYPTFWANRLGLPPEELGTRPDAAGSNLNDLLSFLGL